MEIPEWRIRPVCYRCRKAVESMEVWFDPGNVRHTYRVKCHGEEDSCTVPETFWQDMLPGCNITAVAFLPPGVRPWQAGL